MHLDTLPEPDPDEPLYRVPLPLGGWLAVYLDDRGDPEPCYVEPERGVCVPWCAGDG